MGVPKHKLHTWREYQTWDDGRRYELIGGEVFDMTPAPRPAHQQALGNLHVAFAAFFKGRKCLPFMAPIDVVLSDHDVVQPDLLVVCKPEQIRETHIAGTPALVVEILSPSNHVHDRQRKMRLYATAGVREYWIINPEEQTLEVFLLNRAGKYTMECAGDRVGTVESPSFPGLRVVLEELFDFSDGVWEMRETNSPPAEDVRKP